ncbi:MAG: S1C family serine protease [Candidatus Thorarchaeota archaeon]
MLESIVRRAVEVGRNKASLISCVGVFIVFVVVSSFIGSYDLEKDLPTLINQLTPSVVKIVVEDEYGGWSGSGVFIDDDLILTAGHVVDIQESTQTLIKVVLVDGTELEVVDYYMEDPTIADVGLVKVKWPEGVKKPAPLKLGGEVVVGDPVFAIGEPFGLFPTVTKGIVSALDVDLPDDFYGEADVLQTDCPLNPGNSGCPLFNMKGEIVGICVGGVGVVNQSSGIGFCIPADVCKLVVDKYFASRYLTTVILE